MLFRSRMEIASPSHDSPFSLPNELRAQRAADSLPSHVAFCKYSFLTIIIFKITGCQIANYEVYRVEALVLHGLEATGKSAIIKALLEELSIEPASDVLNGQTTHGHFRYGIVKSSEFVGGRHLLEETVRAVAKAVEWRYHLGRYFRFFSSFLYFFFSKLNDAARIYLNWWLRLVGWNPQICAGIRSYRSPKRCSTNRTTQL